MREKVFHLLLQEEFINRIPFFGYINNGGFMRILITGATSGIGYAVARELIKKGHSLYLETHTKSQLLRLKDRLEKEGLTAICLKIDVTCSKDVEYVGNLDLDCLINHAGIGMGGSLFDTSLATLQQVYDVNIFGNFRLLQVVYHHMRKKNIKGKIFVTSSLASMLPFPYLGCYTSSKAAISMLVFTMRKELKSFSPEMSISLIEPGAYHTGFNQVMIDKKGTKIFEEKKFLNSSRLQRNLFALIEKKKLTSLVKKIVREVESDHPKFKIRAPILQTLFTKFYLLFYR